MLSKAQILDHVWKYDLGGGGVVETYIGYLRWKVDPRRSAADPHDPGDRVHAAPAVIRGSTMSCAIASSPAWRSSPSCCWLRFAVTAGDTVAGFTATLGVGV